MGIRYQKYQSIAIPRSIGIELLQTSKCGADIHWKVFKYKYPCRFQMRIHWKVFQILLKHIFTSQSIAKNRSVYIEISCSSTYFVVMLPKLASTYRKQRCPISTDPLAVLQLGGLVVQDVYAVEHNN